MNFVLEEDTETLDEVVVVGYGVQRKRDLSGSIASVKGDIITEYANTSVASALQLSLIHIFRATVGELSLLLLYCMM